MRINLRLTAMAAICSGALASCASSPSATTTMQVSASARPDRSLNGNLHREVNAWRARQGAAALQRHAGLDRLAQEHSEYLRRNRGKFSIYGKNVSHDGFEGRTLIARQKYNMSSVGENVVSATGGGSNPCPTLVKLWADSKNHAYNMKTSWTHTGVGVVVDQDGTVFATQLFGVENSPHASLTDRFLQF